MDKCCEKIIEIVEEKNLVVDNLINSADIWSFRFFGECKDDFDEKEVLNNNS